MLSLLRNYVYEKIFNKSIAERKRKNNDSEDYPPIKQMKFESNNTLSMSSTWNFQNKLTPNPSENEENCLVNEIFPRKWASSSMMVRQSIHGDKCSALAEDQKAESSSKHSMKYSLYLHNHTDENSESNSNKVTYLSKNLMPTASKDLKSKPVTGKVTSCGTLNSKPIRSESKQSFQSAVKKSLNLMQESYRLHEKVQYMQLLKQQTARSSSLRAPMAFHKMHDHKLKKASIPVIDLTKEKNSVILNQSSVYEPWRASTKLDEVPFSDLRISDVSGDALRGPANELKINSLKDMLKTHPVTEPNLIEQILSHHASESADKKRQAELEETKLKVLTVTNSRAYKDALEEKLRRYMRITTPAIREIEPEKEKYVITYLTKEQEAKVSACLMPSPAGEILVEKFGLQIKRRDLQTLKGLNWLNDEVINFYMNLIMERGKETNLPNVYAFNTFFYPKLISSGHSSLKRWTKKVDIFSHDLILVPVHLGVHWCMALIDFRSKEVKYYDSMGSSNNPCLKALLKYLEAESLDKKKVQYDTSDWQQINVDDIPQQMNGSDCGVFSCVFAEHLARDSPLLFSQDHMPYFRRKMVLEIVEAKLLT